MQKINVAPLQKLNYKTIEEIKKLRTNISFMDPSLKVINITSAVGKEGKSLISFWLAHTIADSSKKVILVDANLRKKDKVNIFEIFREHEDKNDNNKKVETQPQENYLTGRSLKKYLMGKAPKEDIIFESNINNMNFILSGHEAEKPSELLNECAFGTLISYLRENYDYIIIDTPAVGEVTDGVIVAKHCDGSIIVIEPGVVPYELAQKVKEQLENSGTKVLGVVLNKV
jgi:capsular exopolysaccharide synthesis family protein